MALTNSPPKKAPVHYTINLTKTAFEKMLADKEEVDKENDDLKTNATIYAAIVNIPEIKEFMGRPEIKEKIIATHKEVTEGKKV